MENIKENIEYNEFNECINEIEKLYSKVQKNVKNINVHITYKESEIKEYM